jgi:phage terminase large subunit-like protein
VGESIKLWSKVIVKLNISNIIRYEFLKVPVHFDCLIIFFRREHWSLFSTFTCWQQLLDITKKESKDHGLTALKLGMADGRYVHCCFTLNAN